MRNIDSTELKKIQLDILRHVDSFCRQNHIKYFLCGGSMIGAVRHQGYIPWDDDIDIMMLRNDYERFIRLYMENDSSNYHLHDYRLESEYTNPYVKIDDCRTILKEKSETPIKNLGVNIDLFPIDTVPDDKRKQKKMFFWFNFYLGIMDLKRVVPVKSRAWYKNLTLYIAHFLLLPIPMKWLVRKLAQNALQYRGEESSYCAIALWGYGKKEINLRSNWDNTIEMPFEDMLAPLPQGFDNYLTCVYGDYMQLPPKEKRKSHHIFQAWWK